ncbi:sigma-70 family rna polymerase sigma factor : RNA polymerase sigma factor, sigma-70 family OS=Singulisphaera acidiphila (strain ATCC BAA-1392 / DSM 18658 / VKM B-2454 / MOB10) GN=Sinac_6419 PE=4 SV=1: Sigma70_r2: Sigma70_r4_2 [Gemmataceae bacterium]|nr:sigma-70 family rna polymerase sigma factor : RNA polymerase sigma factor, sigma-70 family OS=Singulisphaera acidiphila (strain ATCC BAA-1392 / DSM 18658 / VKM B-2454 / MOB10) GN=Sinac_6419 PE=4 SV=1: Sigma70_r2: Sigma70_r4_2 [Gemmataceae bacterium]VTU01269.1 sigma-70 family rna polymerase sigma factor : RNA polymerase sigma factor, sigma-70 family OS=Singulisphaera acidiphila (strain ATCC BAA-1392 / DSM 18658 / VKM B-2454 / MOB10) GN=Sinac_6419 PE=4 SV=1: Sigma70_r2: Sigma70_r4_2 [Gemmataceae 
MPRLTLFAKLTAGAAAESDHALLARFAADRDEAAFAALVGRHARMVYGVCRRAVRDAQLAEDAVQAVFLVLSRSPERAASAASVGGWLFGIARRVGLTARRHEERRKRLAGVERPTEAAPAADFDDLSRVLDEELAQLPEPYREPLVACFLEERTQDEAARHLGWSLSTLRRRLEHGKELLRVRLTRRGATLAGGLLAGAVAPSARAAVPARLLTSVTEPSARAKSLAAAAVRATLGAKLAVATVALLAVAGVGIGLTNSEPPVDAPAQAPHARHTGEAAPAPRAVERSPWVTVTGRVVFPQERDVPSPQFVAAEDVKDREFFAGASTGDVRVDPATRGLANAVVWLRPDSDDPKAAFPRDRVHPALVDGPGEHRVVASADGFLPRVLAVRAGDRVTFGNFTPVPFNVNYHAGAPLDGDPTDASFNVLLPTGATHTTRPLPTARWCGSVRDNIHPWVHGSVWVFDHPYSAVTAADGSFRIPNAPAGAWRLVVWHERAGYRTGAAGRLGERVVIAADGTLDLGSLVHATRGWDD